MTVSSETPADAQPSRESAATSSGHARDTFGARAEALSGARPRLILVLACFILFLPGFFSVPPLDRDESRFAQATRQMLETGDFITIRYQDGLRNKKPGGIHWLQAGTASLFGGPEAPIWAYRIPSFLGAIGAVLLTFQLGLLFFSRRTALLGAGLLAATATLTIETHISKTDGILILTIVAAQLALARCYAFRHRIAETTDGTAVAAPQTEAPGAATALLFWLALSAQILVKGPIGPMVIGLTMMAISVLDRNIRWLAPLRAQWGIPLLLALTVPYGIALFTATDGAFYQGALGKDFGAKLVSGQEGHGFPPGSYLLIAMIGMWPASIALGPALICGWRTRKAAVTRFLLAWAVPAWLVFEIVPTKLSHYVLPTFPALMLLMAGTLTAAAAAPRQSVAGQAVFGTAGKVTAGLWMLVTLALGGAALWMSTEYEGGRAIYPAGALILIAFAMAYVAVREFLRRDGLRWVVAALAVAVPMYWGIFQVVLPNLDRLAISPRLAATIEALPGYGERPLAITGYAEPSLVFLLSEEIALSRPEEVAEAVLANPDTVAMIERRGENAFRAALEGEDITLVPIGTVTGHNYSNGRSIDLTFYQRTDSSFPAPPPAIEIEPLSPPKAR